MHTVAAIILAAALPAVTNQSAQVAIMWTDYTNRAARVEAARARREANAAKRDAVQTVRDNLKKRKGAAAVKAAVKKGGK